MFGFDFKSVAVAAMLVPVLLMSSAAQAGSATLTNAKTGQTASIHCVGSGCTWSISGGGKPTQNRTGPGGTTNFNKVVAKLKAKGFK